MTKPILCLDFDGVCHSYVSGWKGKTVIPDIPVPGLFEFLEKAKEKFEIQIFSVRSESEDGIFAMKNWFLRHYKAYKIKKGFSSEEDFQLDWILFPKNKPPAFLTIDDRAITFTGKFPEVENLILFKPWNLVK